MNMENYRAIIIRDCSDYSSIIGIIMLNNKINIESFQKEIDRIKEEKYEEIAEYGDDFEIIKENISENFDWFEIGIDNNNLEI